MKILRSKKVYKFLPWVKVYLQDIKYKKKIYKNHHIVKFEDACMVIALTKKNEILTLNQFRHGLKKSSIGFPGGHIKKGEKPLIAAKRELFEETGFKAKKWNKLMQFTRHGTYGCGKDYVFIATNIKKIKDPIENNESYTINLISIEKLKKLLLKNKLDTAGIIAGITFFLLKYSKY